MKGKIFEIKISDLLHQLGSDSIDFDHVFLENMKNISEEGISWTVEFYSMDGKSVFVKLLNLHAEIQEICDRCQTEYTRKIEVKEYSAKYTLDKKEFEESDEEVIFMIDEKKDTIDIEEMIYQAMNIDTPFVKNCEACEQKEIEDEEWEDAMSYL